MGQPLVCFHCFSALIQVTPADGWCSENWWIWLFHLFCSWANQTFLSASNAWGTITTHTCKFGTADMFFLKNIAQVHSESPHLLFGHGLVIKTTFPLEKICEPHPNTQLSNIGNICAFIHCDAVTWRRVQISQKMVTHVLSDVLHLPHYCWNRQLSHFYLFRNRILVVKIFEQYFWWSQKAAFYYFWLGEWARIQAISKMPLLNALQERLSYE